MLKSKPAPVAGIDYDRYGFDVPKRNGERPPFVINKSFVSATPSKNSTKKKLNQLKEARTYNNSTVSAKLVDTKSFSDKEFSSRQLNVQQQFDF